MPEAVMVEPPATREAPAAHFLVDPSTLGHLVVVAHPAAGSFNHAIARAYHGAVRESGQRCMEHDLYATGFDPILVAKERPEAPGFTLSDDVRQALLAVARASVIVLVFPIWFGMPPAMMVGYIDRVLGAGLTATAIRHDETHQLLAGKRLVLLTTSGATMPWLAERGQWHGMREAFDVYLETVFSFDGCEHQHFDSIVTPLHPDYARECLGRAADCARSTCSSLLSAGHARERRSRLSLWTGRDRGPPSH